MKKLKILISQFVICIAFCYGVAFPANAKTTADPAITNLKKMGKAFASIAKQVSPAVVNIYAEQLIGGNKTPWADGLNPFGRRGDGNGPHLQLPPMFEDLFKHFFELPQQEGKQLVVGQGSGFIISKEGYIVTNNHVIHKATKVRVKLQGSSKELEAKIIGMDPRSDIAIIKVDAKGLSSLEFGDSDELDVGEWVLAIGNPFGLSHSISAGIVSAKGRSYMGLTDFEYFIQTDAAINPGNSGGPLLNLEGKVIGINTAIFSRSGGYMGIGFAIPINMAKTIIKQLIDKGAVTRGHLGVRVQALTDELATTFKVPVTTDGILVAQVFDDSPAAKAGIKHGDVVISLDGEEVVGVAEFRNKIAAMPIGSTHKLVVVRDNKEKTIKIKIGKLPLSKEETAKVAEESLSKLGINVQNLTEDITKQLGFKPDGGIIVTAVDSSSLADRVGIKRGNIILELNRKPIKSVSQFKAELNKAAKGNILLLVQNQNGYRYIVIKL